MANTTPDGIYYPENTTDMELDTILATMASSIQNGMGKRLARQELVYSFLGHIPLQSFTNVGSGILVAPLPYQVVSGSRSFNKGFTMASPGVLTIPTKGIYSVTISGTSKAVAAEFNMRLRWNSTDVWKGYTQSTTAAFGYITGSTVVECELGDTLSVAAVWYSTTGTNIVSNSYIDNSFSVTLLKAL